MTIREAIVWNVLEAAKANNDDVVIAACRRLIRAEALGWKKHASADDKAIVWAFA